MNPDYNGCDQMNPLEDEFVQEFLNSPLAREIIAGKAMEILGGDRHMALTNSAGNPVTDDDLARVQTLIDTGGLSIGYIASIWGVTETNLQLALDGLKIAQIFAGIPSKVTPSEADGLGEILVAPALPPGFGYMDVMVHSHGEGKPLTYTANFPESMYMSALAVECFSNPPAFYPSKGRLVYDLENGYAEYVLGKMNAECFEYEVHRVYYKSKDA